MLFLRFGVGERHLALPLPQVREVLRGVAVTPLPQAPPLIAGIIDVRGTLVPVLDVRARVGEPLRPMQLEDRLIVVESAGRTLALWVDRVHWTIEIDLETVESTHELAPDAFYLTGIARYSEGLVVIHDLERFLSAAEEAELARALSAGGGKA